MQITLEQDIALEKITRQAVIKRYIEKGIKSLEGLKELILALGEIKISSKCICGKNHTPQLTFLYDILVNGIKNYIVWANRSGSKSYLAGFITWFASCRYPMCETNILGGSESQSEKSYKAMNDFWRVSNLQDEYLAKEPMITKTEWKRGSAVSILTASQKSVRGGHPQSLVLDEIDEMDFAIYEAALSQPQSKFGIPASIGIYSTNHNIEGTMDKAIQKAGSGYSLYKWCIFDVIESCKDYSCSTCKLHSICPGKQMKEADGYYKIPDFISKMEQLSNDALQREWLCEKVGRGDLVYQHEFDSDIHIVNRPFDKNKPILLSIDWGGVNPFSVGVWQNFDDLGWVRIDEVYKGNTTNQLLLKECKSRVWWENVSEAVADPARADLISEWKDEKTFLSPNGIPVAHADNSVDAGIEAVKAALKPVLGAPKIFINKICVNLLREIAQYKVKNGKVVKENDHSCDDTRYMVMYKVREPEKAAAFTNDWNIMPD